MRRTTTLMTAAAVVAGTLIFGAGNNALADPSSNDWQQLRLCESSNDYSMNSGNNYYGAYQFDLSTWKSVGGTGRPDQASNAEQDFRALYLYRMRGWAPWICASLVGLSDDSDAGSGVKPVEGAGGGGGATTPPPTTPPPATPPPTTPPPTTSPPTSNHGYPGVISFGNYSEALKSWQKQMAAMGYGSFEGTGWFGDKTKAAVFALQKKAGGTPTGILGPGTWAAAWNSKYSLKATSGHPGFPGVVLWGNYSEALKSWQKQMAAMGYGSFEGTGWFGDKTKAAVMELQKRMGGTPTGILGPGTWAAAWNASYKKTAAPAPVTTGPAKYVPATDASCHVGSTTPLPWGGTVMVYDSTYRDLQCFQRQLGAEYGLTGTGFFGSHTRAAVAQLQAKDNLPRTGKVDKATWDAAWARK